jgi:hypothetical protein
MGEYSYTAKKRKKEQSTIQWSAKLQEGTVISTWPPGEMPILPCPEHRMLPIAHGEWTRQKTPMARTARIISQNVGPLGLRKTISLIQRIVNSQRPSIIFLQDCKINENGNTTVFTLRQRQSFPQYNLFIRSGHRQETRLMHLKAGAPRHYQFSVVTLVHGGCGKAQEYKAEDSTVTPHRGHRLTIRVEPVHQNPFLATNFYNYTTNGILQQRELFNLLSSRLETDKDTTHILARDFNASLLVDHRKGYASNSSSRRADMMFEDFVNKPSLHRRWWAGKLIEGILLRRN